MPGFNPENINIHDLTIEEPEKSSGAIFDPERDIREEEWREMKERYIGDMNAAYHVGEKLNHLNTAVDLKILFPERADELNLTNEVYKGLEKTYEVDIRYFAEVVMKIKILFPEKFKELDLDSDSGRMKWLAAKDALEQKKLEFLEHGYNPSDFFDLAAKLKIIFPERTGELNLGDYMAEAMEQYLKDQKRQDSWFNFIWAASNFKMLYPERIKNIHLDDDFWQQTAEKFKKTRYTYGIPLEHFAAHLKILAAENIKFTDNGLEFDMGKPKESLEAGVPPIPEVKNF